MPISMNLLNLLNSNGSAPSNKSFSNLIKQTNVNVRRTPIQNVKIPNTFSMTNIYSNPNKQCGGCGK